MALRKIVLFCLLVCHVQAQFGCMIPSADGTKFVDWWIVFKRPSEYTSYAVDDTSLETGWTKFQLDRNDDNPLRHTLNPYFMLHPKDRSWFSVIAYNNKPPGAVRSSSKSTSKGVMMWTDEPNAAWIVHTIDKFPDFGECDLYVPESALQQAAMAVCLSIPVQQTAKWARQMHYEEPLLYFAVVRKADKPTWEVKALLEHQEMNYSPYKMSERLRTAGGVYVSMYGKKSLLQEDIFSSYLKQALGSMYVWPTVDYELDYLPNDCTTHRKVEGLRGMIKVADSVTLSLEDSSTWLVTTSSPRGDRFWCLSSARRRLFSVQMAQGVTCMQHDGVHALFTQIASTAVPIKCP